MWMAFALVMAMQPFDSAQVKPGASPVQTVVRDGMSPVDEAKQVVARTPTEWTAVWRQHAGETPAPKVDFRSRTVVAVFLGSRPSAGYAVEITGTREQGGILTVEWRESRPPRGQITAQVMTSPAHIATIPKFAGEITFHKVEP
jgi:hypothetical protein